MNKRGLGTKWENSHGQSGRYVHYFSQSLLNTFLKCPEQARHELLGDVPRIESPKMALGTAGHAAIEAVLRDIDVLCMTRTMEEAFNHYANILLSTFEDRMYLTEFKEDPKLGLEWARKRGVSALSAWWDDVLPQLKPALVEEPIEKLIYSDNQRQIIMKGTIDMIDTEGVIWDWKFSGSERDAWKDRRGSVQATTYTWAKETNRFKYCTMPEGGGVQIVDLTVPDSHRLWLVEQALSMAYLIEANLPAWPKIDLDWPCSPRWCSVFADGKCKGEYFPRRIEENK